MECLRWILMFAVFKHSSTWVNAVNRKSTVFTEVKKGRIPIYGMTKLKAANARSFADCADICLNQDAGDARRGFVFQPFSCVSNSTNSKLVPGICETMKFADTTAMVLGPAVSSCQVFYAGKTSILYNHNRIVYVRLKLD